MASNNSNISAADILRILKENPELKVDPVVMNLGVRIVWDILFGGMLFVAVVGNLIVLWIVIGKLGQVFYESHKSTSSVPVLKTLLVWSYFSEKCGKVEKH